MKEEEMGVYDYYEGVQLKVGLCNMEEFNIGDDVDIDDGVYIGYEGVAIINNGKLMATFPFVLSKWGDKIVCSTIIEPLNPIARFVENLNESI